MEAIQLQEIRKEKAGRVVLDVPRLSFRPNQRVAIAGETGSGKSTLLKIMAGLEQPDQGEVHLGDDRIKGPAETLVPGDARVAYLSQHFELPKFLRVEQVLTYANQLSADHATQLYQMCRIDHLLTRSTDQLSGGERQRVAIARLLSTDPQWLLLDEPFSHLDFLHKSLLKQVLTDASRERAVSVLLVSHEPSDTLSWADEMIAMKAGHVLQQGPPALLYQQPVDRYVAGLLGSFTELDEEGKKVFGAKGHPKSFFRPEDFSFHQEGVPGRVERLLYFGAHVDAMVDTGSRLVAVRTVPGKVVPGEQVRVSIAAE